MKKLFTRALLAFSAVVMFAFTAKAQQMPPIPVDTMVRIGQLPNGLTYYIRHNEMPKGQADFFIAQKVGSILEEDNQRGLAHFLEHMCFNGTTNFPGSRIVDWLESVGVKFGQNLNAYTSIDETVYNISNVPIARESVQDSCLLILHDWANDLLLEDAEIDKERGVIHQEWRRSMVGQMRILENLLPVMFTNSRYGVRLPIGTMDVVDNFPYQALRDYYEAWYRPDQQGVIVVGDIDVDRIEKKIIEMFSDIKMPENAPERVYLPVENNEGTIYAIGSDKEQQYAIVSLMFKTEAFPKEMKGNTMYLMQNYLTRMITSMLNNRFQEMASNPDTKFAQASASYGDVMVAKTAEALDITGVAKDDNILPVIETVYRELLRAQRGGFTYGEYERARNEYISRLEKAYNNRNNVESGNYAQEYVRHFIDNEPIPTIEFEYQFMNSVAPNIPVDAINMILPQLITNDNRIVMALLPEKEGVANPTEAEIAEVIAKVDAEEIAPYVDEVKAEPLIPQLPAAGKIVSEKQNEQWGATEMVLSNGVKVIVKQTKFKEDEIRFNATAVGGTSILGDENAIDLKAAQFFIGQAGLGDYTNSDLQKYLSGKQVGVSVSFDDYSRDVTGFSTPKDMPTLMELIYMYFTNVNITEKEAQAVKSQVAGILKNQESNPQFIFQRDMMKALFASPKRQMITADEVMQANAENCMNICKQMTANAADYQFVFVGNIDLDSFRPLVEQYIATLPADVSKIRNTAKIDKTLEIKDGSGIDATTTKMETPQTYVFFALCSQMPYTAKNAAIASIAGQVLSNRLLKTVREEMGAVYSIGASAHLSRIEGKNAKNATIQSSFPMKPELKQDVLNFIDNELKALEKNVTEEELAKYVEFMVKTANESLEKNDAWMNGITGWCFNGVDTFNGKVEVLESITVKDIKNFFKKMRAAKNHRIVTLDPAE